MTEAFIRTASEYPSYRVAGQQIAVPASAAETGGLEMFHQVGRAGEGPPPHAHPWDETMLIVKGEVEIGIGDRSVVCGPGGVAHMPAGTSHWFRFASDGEMVTASARGGGGACFAEIDLVTQGAPDFDRLLPVALRHGLSLPEPANPAR